MPETIFGEAKAKIWSLPATNGIALVWTHAEKLFPYHWSARNKGWSSLNALHQLVCAPALHSLQITSLKFHWFRDGSRKRSVSGGGPPHTAFFFASLVVRLDSLTVLGGTVSTLYYPCVGVIYHIYCQMCSMLKIVVLSVIRVLCISQIDSLYQS